MRELYINIHNLVHIWSPEISAEVYSGMQRLLGHFYVDSLPAGCKADIIIVPLSRNTELQAQLKGILPSPYGISFVRHDGETGIVFSYRGKPDLVLLLGPKITINYTPRDRNTNRIYGLILFTMSMVLHKKMGLLYHGAGLQRNGVSLLFTGLRGSKKTHLAMTMMHRGWDFIGDDKIIIHDGNMYSFQDIIPIADHHVEGMPWLYDLLPPAIQRSKSAFRRKLRAKLAATSRRWLSEHIQPVARKFYDPQHITTMAQLFPERQKIESAKPDAVVLLTLGDKVACNEVESNEILEEITAIQSLFFYSMGPLEQLIYFCNKSYEVTLGEVVRENIVRANLADLQFFRLTIPGQADLENVYEALNNEIEHKLR